jgi:hypothetical protein
MSKYNNGKNPGKPVKECKNTQELPNIDGALVFDLRNVPDSELPQRISDTLLQVLDGMKPVPYPSN